MPKRGRPSLTAAKIARMLVFAGNHEHYAKLLPEAAAATTQALLLEAGVMTPRIQRLYQRPRFRAWLERLGERLYPGQLARVALRKRFMDDELRAALDAGARQVLVLGAGYDAACMRLAPAFGDRLFVEIDHDATHERKRAGIEALGGGPENLRLLGVDLAHASLIDALAQLEAPRWDPEQRSVVVAEGLLMYLASADVARLFEAVHALTGPGSRMLFTYLRCDSDGRPYLGRKVGWLSRWSLKAIGEAIIWCVADELALARFVAKLGWHYESAVERFDLGARYLAPAGLDDREQADPLEFMAVVDRRGSSLPRR